MGHRHAGGAKYRKLSFMSPDGHFVRSRLVYESLRKFARKLEVTNIGNGAQHDTVRATFCNPQNKAGPKKIHKAAFNSIGSFQHFDHTVVKMEYIDGTLFHSSFFGTKTLSMTAVLLRIWESSIHNKIVAFNQNRRLDVAAVWAKGHNNSPPCVVTARKRIGRLDFRHPQS